MPIRHSAVHALAAAVACLVFTASCRAQPSASRSSLDNFRPQFEAVLKEHGVVGGGLALVRNQGSEQTLAFGEARRENHQPVDSATAYNWASITKTMTAIAILQLRDRGKLSLDDPAVRYVPELREVHDAFGNIDSITIRQLLTHSAGFRNPTWPWDCDDASNCDWQPFEPTRWSQVAAMLPYTHVAFMPGSRWSYSNLGYVFLGQIIERLSGDDFEVYIDKNILKPLGMTNSYFDCCALFSRTARLCKLSPRRREAHSAAFQLRHGHYDLQQRAQSADYRHGKIPALPHRRSRQPALRNCA